jgi:hypothetical protein
MCLDYLKFDTYDQLSEKRDDFNLANPTLMDPIIQWNCRCRNINFTVQAFLPIAGVSTILASLAFYIVVLISTHLQAVVVRISLDKTITLCSVYIPPNLSLSLAQLKNIAGTRLQLEEKLEQ